MTDFSFEKVNYSLRPNKSVERKLIVRLLAEIDQKAKLGIKSYSYIGLGSMWFVDFVLVHRTFEISSLISIEREESRKTRAEFNRPYSCVRVEPGDTTKVFPTLITKHPKCIVWLDYDDELSDFMFEDIETFCRGCMPGSIFLASVNANLSSLRQDHKTLESQAAELRRIAGSENVPADAEIRLSRNSFPALVNEILLTKMQSFSLLARRELKFVPLANFGYSDGVPMATCGGLVATQEQESVLVGMSKSRYEHLAMPQLTHKEKLELDRHMPSESPPDHRTLPFELKQTEIDAYWKYYLQYPLYSELLF